MKVFFKMFFASLSALVFLVVVCVGIVGVKSSQKPEVKDGSYLVIDIYGEILPYNPPNDIVAEIVGGKPETLHRILDNLEKAAVDDRIEGVVIKVSSNNPLGAASVQEIRGAIKRLREAGKKVYAFSDSIDRKVMFLASACDSIFAPNSANVYFVGYGRTVMYVKKTLEKLGITPSIHKIDEYKSAAELVLREDMSPEAREMYNWLIDDMWEMEMKAISEGRGLSEPDILALMERALFTAPQANEAGLIDRILYWDELTSMLKQEDDEELRTVSQEEYAEVDREKLGLKGDKKIAVVHAFGSIGGRKSHVDPMLGMMMGHESVTAELRRVRRDEDVAAVVFRIESGGGESLASDLIGSEIELLASEKPVVVSMIDVAASGGYSIAYRASKLLADPMTITGSIGSISGKFNTTAMYNKIGMTFDHVSKGPNGFLWSEHHEFTEDQWNRFKENHWDGFNIWLEDVAEHRGIDLEDLKKLAMGRVWTGRQALDNGLIDELGGIDRAIELAKELAEIPEDDGVSVVHYPEKQGLLDMVTGGGGAKAAIRWVLYNFIRDDVANSIEMLQNGVVPFEQALPE